ncbi:Short-chain dehydrogenase [Amycolatopsis marina]|uniref:Short-chain dehydrogenase n=1 Tax=Amycolatopsis marina TaxID=490629 RepID=A0A1I1AZ33_9PSEU|nr:SDR family NAD(P)-dependent oxidoreductase [Amycolatopsis marina]SFB41523.1 Short-chain dehydrogenase [Amycolatopsis marina]
MSARGRVRTALVTGAASGMGRMAAQRLAAAGVRVAAVDLDSSGLADTALRSSNTHTFSCDVTDAAAVTGVVERVTGELGPIDRLVHAAGLCRIGPALEHALPSLRRVVEVNFLGTVHVTRAVVPGMLDRGDGEVVLFGSLAGWLPSPRLAAYSASKFAVTAFAEVLAQEVAGSGVRVLCVCPGQVETPLAQGVRAIDPGVLGGRSGMPPEEALDAVEAALASRRAPLFVFPGRGTSQTVLARRLLPNLLRRQIIRHVRPAR